jgi:hypothetical protein
LALLWTLFGAPVTDRWRLAATVDETAAAERPDDQRSRHEAKGADMKRGILLFLAIASVSAPVAIASGPPSLSPVQRIIRQEDRGGHVSLQPSPDVSPAQRIIVQENARRNDPALLGPGPAPTTVTVVDSGGFNWGDASIGAAVVVAAMLVLAGSVLVLRAGRPRRA